MKKDILIVTFIAIFLALFIYYLWSSANICTILFSPSEKSQCYEKIGTGTNNLDICIKSDNYQCYQNLALKTNDINICNRVNDKELKNRCMLLVTINKGDPQLCDNLIYEDKVYCYYRLALSKNDTILCEKTSEKWSSGCYKFIAINLLDPTICEKISTLNPFVKDECYLSIAFKKNDPSLCQRVKFESEKERCNKLVIS